MTEGQRKAAQRRGGQRSAQAQRSEERRFNAVDVIPNMPSVATDGAQPNRGSRSQSARGLYQFNAEEPLHKLVEEPDEVVETIIETEYGKVEW